MLEALLKRAASVIVMAESGREILERVYGADARKVVMIPHGVPDRAFADPETFKERFGWAGRKVVLTFGLLAPGKGIETRDRGAADGRVRRAQRALRRSRGNASQSGGA